ncbi:MAG: hypothetical protein ACRD2W_06845 [Acidimicrobiales bacterium]
MVVVDDNELTMLGLASAIEASAEVELVATLHHGEALAWTDEWHGVDAVVVDAADEQRVGDQFPGVAVVRRVRSVVTDRRLLVVVVTGHSLHDGLRHRMADADADLFFNRSDIASAATLVEVILHPERWRRVDAATAVGPLPNLGIERADVDQFVAYVEEHGLEGALDPDQPARADPRSRRWLRHRREISKVARIEPVNLTTGNRPLEWEAPSIRQLSRIWAWAARIGRSDR